jgi:hypothetical protein
MKPNLQLPNRIGPGPIETISCEGNLVIIGANGAGKTRLGSWIEKNPPDGILVHRISAQRALNIPDYTTIKTLEQAEKSLFWGRDDPHAEPGSKWGSRWGNSPETFLLNDYDFLLSTLFAQFAKRNAEHTKETREKGVFIPVPQDPIDIISSLWTDIMPQRHISFEDGRVFARKEDQDSYAGKLMSDGERVALYLIGQCLCAPPNSIIIIDEPEIHLHRSLMVRLWNKIEEVCPEKLLVFITHDLDFAASRKEAKKIWIENFDGASWKWDEVPNIDEIPENLTIEILGNRKNILFSEGDKSSYDTILYQLVYPNYHVIPRGGCEKVIESTKAMKETLVLNHLSAHGIIDRDYRTDDEIRALENADIYVIGVAEVENLFCIEPLLRIVAANQGMNADDKVREATDLIIDCLQTELDVQVVNRTERQIQFRLNAYIKKANSVQGLHEGVDVLLKSFDIDAMYAENQKLYQEAIECRDVVKALRIYNRKNLPKRIATIFELNGNGYTDLVLRLLKTDKKQEIINGLRTFVPQFEN